MVACLGAYGAVMMDQHKSVNGVPSGQTQSIDLATFPIYEFLKFRIEVFGRLQAKEGCKSLKKKGNEAIPAISKPLKRQSWQLAGNNYVVSRCEADCV